MCTKTTYLRPTARFINGFLALHKRSTRSIHNNAKQVHVSVHPERERVAILSQEQ